jgi:hypothetical protein
MINVLVKTLDQPEVLAELAARLRALKPDTPRRWGTLTPGEMLCHVADATAGPLSPRNPLAAGRWRVPLLKWAALYPPLPWPRGIRTHPKVNPRAKGTKPSDFAADRDRAIAVLEAFARAEATDLAPDHFVFGPMTVRAWKRWAYRHTDHHLRQFGL